MKNTLIDLHDSLMAQIERLSDEGLCPERLEHEVSRSHAMSRIARDIIANGETVLAAERLRLEYGQARRSDDAGVDIFHKRKRPALGNGSDRS